MTNERNEQGIKFGFQDYSYKAAGEQAGITKLVDDFYASMCKLPRAKRIRDMHPANLDQSRDKLTLFLCAWLGGPHLFSDKYGAISIPQVHSHLDVIADDKEAWLECMQAAIDVQGFSPEFGEYLIRQLAVPAQRIEQVCGHIRAKKNAKLP
jgi:hemoglobin